VLTALLFLAQVPSPGAAVLAGSDQVLALELDAGDPPFAGRGASERRLFHTEFEGALQIWARPAGALGLYLRAETTDGELVAEDDDFDGGASPCLQLQFERCSEFVLVVAARAGQHGALGLELRAAPETEATRAGAVRARTALDELRRLRAAGEVAAARALATRAIDELCAVEGGARSQPLTELARLLGLESHALDLLAATDRAWGLWHEHCAATLPPDHPHLQRARGNHAIVLKGLGQARRAEELERQVLEVRQRTHAEDDPELQYARANLALSLKARGDYAAARRLEERVLEIRERTLPEAHHDRLWASLNLSTTLAAQADLEGARELQEQVLAVAERELPADHDDRMSAEEKLAATLRDLGELARARELIERVQAHAARSLPADHPQLLVTRELHATILYQLGALQPAHEILLEVVESLARQLPADDPTLLTAQLDLALTTRELGDAPGARALEEQVLSIRARTLPEEHPELLVARSNLATTLLDLGDVLGARALQQQVFEVRSRTLPPDHPELLSAQGNLAVSLQRLGDLERARSLREGVLAAQSRRLADDHPALQIARSNLAVTCYAARDYATARALMEKVLAVQSRRLPEDHPDLLSARKNLAATLFSLALYAEARPLQELVLESALRRHPPGHEVAQSARHNLAATLRELGELSAARALLEESLAVRGTSLDDARSVSLAPILNLALCLAAEAARAGAASASEPPPSRRQRCGELIGRLCAAETLAAERAILGSPPREAEERCAAGAHTLDVTLSFAAGFAVFEPLDELWPEAFALSETARGAALTSAALARRAAGAPRYGELRRELARASEELARGAQRGLPRAEFEVLLARREALERELAQRVEAPTAGGLRVDLEACAAALGPGRAACAWRRTIRWGVAAAPADPTAARGAGRETAVESLCAFVVRGTATAADGTRAPAELTVVDLGPLEPIAAAVRAWRGALGAAPRAGRGQGLGARAPARELAELGAALRARVLDPLLPACGDATRLVLVADDVLHLVPFEALPAPGEDGALVGDRWRIELRATLSELLASHAPPARLAGNAVRAERLLALGDVDFGGSESAPHDARSGPELLRDGSWAGFAPLPGTAAEVEALAQLAVARPELRRAADVLRGPQATRARLVELAPGARWLHVATHGWFAPESLRGWEAGAPLDAHSGLVLAAAGAEPYRRQSPLLLCGLALAGANLPDDALGRARGLLTADEVATLDLADCELAVLSACDTNVGELRAGQGVASLQRALHMAGARSVVTSLWKVPDQATRELMLEFYRRLWVERQPKGRALWGAKAQLRAARDAQGRPLYGLHDWGAWVLTGEPD